MATVETTACWRCGAPSQRQGQRSTLCLTCLEMLAEIATLHHRPVPTSGERGCTMRICALVLV